MLKPRRNRRSGWGKGILDQIKYGWVGQRSRWYWLIFLVGKAFVHHEFLPHGQMVNKQLYQDVLARLWDAVRRKRPELWENQTLGCCTTTKRRITRRSSSAVIWQNIRHPLCPIHPILRTYPQQTFSCFPNLKNHFERTSFPSHTGDSGKCDKRTARHHKKCVPGSIPTMEEMLGTVYRQQRGPLWRGQCLKCCKMSNKGFIAKVRSFFWIRLVYMPARQWKRRSEKISTYLTFTPDWVWTYL